MSRLLWIENALPLNTRSSRILGSLEKSGQFEICVCAWNRDGRVRQEESLPRHWIYRTATGDKRLVRKTVALPGFISFVRQAVREVNCDVIVSSFWDATLAATYAARGTGVPVIYDVLDMPGGGPLMYHAGRLLETMALRRVDGVLLASRFYEPYYRRYVPKRLVLENLPSLPNPIWSDKASGRVRVAYVGSVRYPETLAPLFLAATEQGIAVDVYGDGPDAGTLARDGRWQSTVTFHGRYEYEDLSSIYEKVDVVWAAYPPHSLNVRKAISNKYFESLWFGVPGVFSAETELGRMVAAEGTGFVVDAEDQAAVAELLRELSDKPSRLLRAQARLDEKRAAAAHELKWQSQEGALMRFVQDVLASK